MTVRHDEDRLGGVVEAALSKAMNDDGWLTSMAQDPNIDQNTDGEVFRALEDYVCNWLARIE